MWLFTVEQHLEMMKPIKILQKCDNLYFCKIKTPPIPVSDVLPLFWFFIVQYISIFVLIIAYISNF